MSVVNKIEKGGAMHDIAATYDDLEQKISETYATKSDLATLDATIQSLQGIVTGLTNQIAALEAKHTEA